MEFHYHNISLEIEPHDDGFELQFGPAAGSAQGSDDPPQFSLTLTREGLQALAQYIQDFLAEQD